MDRGSRPLRQPVTIITVQSSSTPSTRPWAGHNHPAPSVKASRTRFPYDKFLTAASEQDRKEQGCPRPQRPFGPPGGRGRGGTSTARHGCQTGLWRRERAGHNHPGSQVQQCQSPHTHTHPSCPVSGGYFSCWLLPPPPFFSSGGRRADPLHDAHQAAWHRRRDAANI